MSIEADRKFVAKQAATKAADRNAKATASYKRTQKKVF